MERPVSATVGWDGCSVVDPSKYGEGSSGDLRADEVFVVDGSVDRVAGVWLSFDASRGVLFGTAMGAEVMVR